MYRGINSVVVKEVGRFDFYRSVGDVIVGAILITGVFGITVEDYLAVDGLQFRAKLQQHNRIRRLAEYQGFPFFLDHGDAVAIDPVDQSD